MKVIHIVASIDKSAGGPSRSVPQTCEQVSGLGINIELITRPSEHPVTVITNSNFKVTFRSISDLLIFGLSLSKKEVSLIHLQHVWDPYIHIMAWLARMKGIPYMITPRGMLEPWIMQRHPLKKRLAMWFYQRKDIERAFCLQATCEMEKDSIRKLGFTNPIVVIPNGINLSVVPKPKETFEKKRIIFLSRIHQKKGIELLLEAWKTIDTNAWELIIAGEGDAHYTEKIKNRITDDELTNVELVGPKYNDEKWDFFRSGDIMGLPTYSENFGIVIAEALVMGIPVITTRGTPWQELETHQCGWWIELNVDNLAKALNEAMSASPDVLKEMGQRGRKLVEENYDIRAVANRMKALYRWIEGEIEKPDFVSLD